MGVLSRSGVYFKWGGVDPKMVVGSVENTTYKLAASGGGVHPKVVYKRTLKQEILRFPHVRGNPRWCQRGPRCKKRPCFIGGSRLLAVWAGGQLSIGNWSAPWSPDAAMEWLCERSGHSHCTQYPSESAKINNLADSADTGGL